MDNAHTAVTLLPCPFCGGEATINKRLRDGYRFAECESCAFGLCVERTEAEAITAWNHRATTADLQARLEASEARVAELVEGVRKHIEMLRHGYAPFIEGALSEAMCCSGQMCGCRGASVGEYLAHLLEQDTGLALATTRNADAKGGGA